MKTSTPSRPSEDVWRCVRVNTPRDRGPILATAGWFVLAVSAEVEAGRHQTALRGRADAPSGATTVALNERRLRNLSVPTNRSSKTASSTPFGLTAWGGDSPRESR